MKLPFRWIREDRPGAGWASLLRRTWPAYRRWFLAEGEDRRPGLAEARAALELHMPELVPTWERLVRLADGDPDVARMLPLYRPAPYLAGCSQAVWLRDRPMLVRNYDYHPGACEGIFLLSDWNGTKVLASGDCLWGALDGMNEHGLVLALAFGGRRVAGDGFGIPLILRYALETCRTTAGALAVLQRIPSHMPYNVSVLDVSGDHAVVVLGPDREPLVQRTSVATNHQPSQEWSEYDAWTRSAERERHLLASLDDPELDGEAFLERFLVPPLHATHYERGYGTLYTAAYFPGQREACFLWPGTRVDQGLETFEERSLVVPLLGATADRPRSA